MTPDWKKFDPALPLDKRPGVQLVLIEGAAFHSGVNWRRFGMGPACVNEHGPQGYHAGDIKRIMERYDIEVGDVTYWAPWAFFLPSEVLS